MPLSLAGALGWAVACAENRQLDLRGQLSNAGTQSTSAGGTTGGAPVGAGSAGMPITAGTDASGGMPSSGGVAGTDASGGSAGSDASGGAGAGGSAGSAGSGGSAGGGGTCAACTALKAALVHRYTFEGTGSQVTDSVGNVHGTITGPALSGSGRLALTGTDHYVSFSSSPLSGLTQATLEMWVAWSGGGAWQRIFDFGSSSAGAGAQGDGVTYLFLTPQANDGQAPQALRVAFSTDGPMNETLIDAAMPLSTTATVHVAIVVDGMTNALRLYVEGVSAGTAILSNEIADLNLVNNWLGRSQFSADPEFAGDLLEFRIYNTALAATAIQTSYNEGPDPAFLLD